MSWLVDFVLFVCFVGACAEYVQRGAYPSAVVMGFGALWFMLRGQHPEKQP